MNWSIAFWRKNGVSLSLLIDSWYANAGTTGLVWDLTIAAIALTVWILLNPDRELRRLRQRYPGLGRIRRRDA